jgi:alpha-beta hydrolase superfamily lysophospholipase
VEVTGADSQTRLRADDGAELFLYIWRPVTAPRAAIQIVHGMAEHAGRYARSAQQLTAAGFAVYAIDLRGHGRTAAASELGYFAPRGGWQRVVADLHCVQQRIAADLPGVARFMLGHSMGSMLLRDYLCSHAPEIAGAVLSSTSGGTGVLAKLGGAIARLERRRLGATGHSQLLQRLSFGNFNKAFAPNRTEYDWLSRDHGEVDKYVSDPLCGFPLTVQGWIDVFTGIEWIEHDANICRMRGNLPIYLFSGDRDPVGRRTRGVHWLINAYRRLGLTELTFRFYPEGRHEMLNETNRDEVHRDLIAWFDAVLDRSSAAAA